MITLEGLDQTHRLGIQFDNVVFDDASAIKISAKHADVTVGPGPFNLTVQAPDVNVTMTSEGFAATPGRSAANSCTGKFVEFPALQ